MNELNDVLIEEHSRTLKLPATVYLLGWDYAGSG